MESLNRKRFLLRNSSEEIRHIQSHVKEYQSYEQSTRIINEMVINVRTLLYRTKTIKEDIEHTKQQDLVSALQTKIEEYRKFQKTLQRPFFSNTPLDESMTGAFVMRLCREVSYWASVLVFVVNLVDQIDGVFCEQKKNDEFNIELIYFLAIKKINSKADEIIKVSYDRMMTSFSSENEEEKLDKTEMDVMMDPITLLAMERDKNKAKMKEMEQYMNKMINRTYRGLQITSFEPIRIYKIQMSEDFNMSALLKKQLKRNKKLKKQLEQFDESYKIYKKKRLHRINSLIKIESRKSNSIIKGSLKSLVSIKDLVNKEQAKKNIKFPVLAPSRFDNQLSNAVSLGKPKKNSRGRMFSSSKQKLKPKTFQKKQNNLLFKPQKLKL